MTASRHVTRILTAAAVLSAGGLTLLAPADAHAVWDEYDIVDSCQWATSVQIRGNDGSRGSGVYVGNGLVLTAAHVIFESSPSNDSDTGLPAVTIDFGEVEGDEEYTLQAECTVHPSYDQEYGGLFGDSLITSGPDIAYCRIDGSGGADHITAFGGNSAYQLGSIVLPMIPTGCERDYLYEQLYFEPDPVIAEMVGSGCKVQSNCTAHSWNYGDTRWVDAEFIRQINDPAGSGSQVLEVYQPDPYGVTDGLIKGPVTGGDSGSPPLRRHARRNLSPHRRGQPGPPGKQLHGLRRLSQLRRLRAGADLPALDRDLLGREDLTPCHDWVQGEGYLYGSVLSLSRGPHRGAQLGGRLLRRGRARAHHLLWRRDTPLDRRPGASPGADARLLAGPRLLGGDRRRLLASRALWRQRSRRELRRRRSRHAARQQPRPTCCTPVLATTWCSAARGRTRCSRPAVTT